MKKKLSVYFGILIGFIALFFITTYLATLIKKQPLDAQNYIKIMEQTGYKVENVKQTTNGTKSSVNEEFLSQEKNYQIRFAVLNDVKTAKIAFSSIYSGIKKQSSENTDKAVKMVSKKSQKGRNFEIVSAKIKNDYFMITQIDNTVLLMISNYKNKDAINSLADNLGYGYTYFEEILSVHLLFLFAFIALLCTPFAFVLKKAGKNPLSAFIPFYNDYCLCQIADKNGWKMLLLLVPIINIIYRVMLSFKLSYVFKKSEAFGIGIFFLPVIFLPILAFDNSKYVGIKQEENQ